MIEMYHRHSVDPGGSACLFNEVGIAHDRYVGYDLVLLVDYCPVHLPIIDHHLSSVCPLRPSTTVHRPLSTVILFRLYRALVGVPI